MRSTRCNGSAAVVLTGRVTVTTGGATIERTVSTRTGVMTCGPRPTQAAPIVSANPAAMRRTRSLLYPLLETDSTDRGQQSRCRPRLAPPNGAGYLCDV